MTHGGAGRGRKEGCPLLSHLNLGMLNPSGTGAVQDLGYCCSPGFLSPLPGCLWGQEGSTPSFASRKGEESWPQGLSLQLKAAQHSAQWF